MRKNFFPILLMVILVATAPGCALFKNPFKSWTKAETKVETTQKAVATNQEEIVKQGKNYVYATKLALDADTSTNQVHDVEVQLNDKAIATLGTPTMDQIVVLQAMVKNLLSTNQILVAKGEKQLAAQDAMVANLQSVNSELLGKLDVATKKLTEVGTTNAGLAQKWNDVVKVFWWIVYAFIFVAVIKVLAVVLPPPYNSIVGIIAVPIGLFTKLIHSLVPEAKAVAGVVSSEYKTTTEQLLTAIQKLKDANPTQHTEISKTVSNTVDSTLVSTINTAKAAAGIVS